MIDLDGMSEDDARLVTKYQVETISRRRRLGYVGGAAAHQLMQAAWEAFEQAYPQGPDWVRPPEPSVSHEEAQIEKIGRTIWDIFHVRHGGEYDPSSNTIAASHTRSAADECWAIAQAPEPMTARLMVTLMGDLDIRARDGDWDYLSEVYASLNPTRMSTGEIVTYLRPLHCARDKITSYDAFLERSRVALDRRGERAEITLRGLLD